MTKDSKAYLPTVLTGWAMIAVGIWFFYALLFGACILTSVASSYASMWDDYERVGSWRQWWIYPVEFVLRFVMALVGIVVIDPLKILYLGLGAVLSKVTP
jgi:hypothetical protein